MQHTRLQRSLLQRLALAMLVLAQLLVGMAHATQHSHMQAAEVIDRGIEHVDDCAMQAGVSESSSEHHSGTHSSSHENCCHGDQCVCAHAGVSAPSLLQDYLLTVAEQPLWPLALPPAADHLAPLLRPPA